MPATPACCRSSDPRRRPASALLMDHAVSELQRIGLKLFFQETGEDAAPLRSRDFIPVFHGWIQTHAVDGLLIDVVDYEHLPEGPGVMLVAHEGNYSIDLRDRRMGLLYFRKQAVDGSLPQRLVSLCRLVLEAGRLLENEPQLGGRVKFRGDQVQLIANDRLLAPNTEDTLTALRSALSQFLNQLYDGAECEVSRDSDPQERLTLTVRAPQPVSIQTLLDRVGG